MREFSLADLLPMPPWLGPPLPQFLGIYWPVLQGQNRPELKVEQIFSGPKAKEEGSRELSIAYSNVEQIEFPDGFDPDTFMPRRIVIHRKTETR